MFFGLNDVAFLAAVAAGPALWTPADIATALWLDADDESTITAVAGVVSEWRDKSGNSRHATQSTESARPIVSVLNSKAAIDFAGTAVQLSVNRGFITNQISAFAVIGGDSSGNQRFIDQRSAGAVGTSKGWQVKNFQSVSGDITIFDGGDGNATFINISETGAAGLKLWTVMYSSAVGAALLLNGSAHGVINVLGNGLPADIDNTSRNIAIGGNADGSSTQTYTGMIQEIILLSSYASTDTRQRTEGYLAHKWGLTANLPNDHPYKTAAPTV
jgi:hypothetical protein